MHDPARRILPGRPMSAGLPAERGQGYPAPEGLVARREAAGAMGDSQVTAPGVTVDEEALGGVPSLVFRPVSPTGTILYFHGGGYRLGAPRAWTTFASGLAASTGTRVVVPDYRLAPEHAFPAAVLDAVAVFDALVAPPSGGTAAGPATAIDGPLLVAGDSAGGGLAAALVVACQRSGRPVPAGMVALSPWADLRVTAGTFTANAASDQFFPQESAKEGAEQYLQGASADDPLASPLLADFAGFPPSLVFAGGAETLLDDGLGLTASLARAGVTVEGHFVAGMQHVWPTLFPELPESVAASEAIVRFVDRVRGTA